MSTIACLLVPRFALAVAVGERQRLLGHPVALAPQAPGQGIGEVSGAAEALGVRRGMRLAEALARCPELVLVPPDPARVQGAWEGLLERLEGIGAAVESEAPGQAFFALDGLTGIWGSSSRVLTRARRVVGMPVRLGAGPGRFCAFAAAGLSRSGGRGNSIVPDGGAREFLSPLPVALLKQLPGAAEEGELVGDLERLGVRTLGALAELPADALADRFGRAGLTARALALGEDEPLRPRPVLERLRERLELPEAASGPQLERALELLVDRLLARPDRRARTIRGLRLTARLAAGGSWSSEVPLREASADAVRLRLALAPKLAGLSAPAEWLELEGLGFGPAAGIQASLDGERERRRGRLAEAIRQVRAAAGRGALLRVLELDPTSRIPERRMTLTPFPEDS